MPVAASVLSVSEKAKAAFYNMGAFWKSGGTSSSYSINNSLRFNGTNSYLSRTVSTTSNRNQITFSAWVKRSKFGVYHSLAYAASASNIYTFIMFTTNDTLMVRDVYGGVTYFQYETTQVFRDPSAWYHIVVAIDGQASAGNKVKFYVNGVNVARAFPNDSADSSRFNLAGETFNLFRDPGVGGTPGGYFDGYAAEIYWIDGLALDQTSFGQTDSTTGQWVPKKYTGSFGTNGFYLPFNDGTSTTTLGYDRQLGLSDSSKNNWTLTNFNTYDQVIDSPTNNFCVLNPLDKSVGTAFGAGNLMGSTGVGSVYYGTLRGTQAVSSGKWYWEVKATVMGGVNQVVAVGITGADNSVSTTEPINNSDGSLDANSFYYYSYGRKTNNTGWTSYGVTWDTTKTVSVKLDMDAGTLEYLVDNVSQGVAFSTGISGKRILPALFDPATGGTVLINFGQGGQSGLTYDSASGGRFKYAPPSGFKALCTSNLPTPTIAKPNLHFDVKTYAGSGGVTTVGSSSFYKLTYPYSIGNSLRFNGTNQFLARTLSSSGNQKVFTWSGWIKIGKANPGMLFSQGDGSARTILGLYGSNGITFLIYPSYAISFTSSQVFTDSSKWYHICLSVDTNQAVASNGVRIWVDGVFVTTWSANAYAQNTVLHVNNSAYPFYLGKNADNTFYFDGYMSEVNFIDGQALTPTSFGQWDSTGTTWIPKAYTGTYGTNGFYLNFSSGTNTTTLGADASGNSNNWTLNNFTRAAGTAECWMSDTPTNNYATLNPLDLSYGTLGTGGISNGGLNAVTGSLSANGLWVKSTIPIPTYGKWYWEVTMTSLTNSYDPGSRYRIGVNDGYITELDISLSVNDVIGVAFDATTNQSSFYRNGISLGITKTTNRSSYNTIHASSIMVGDNGVSYSGQIFNFGQRAFSHGPPDATYKALSVSNASAPASTVWMPALAVVKSRTNAYDWCWADNLRGAFMGLASNTTNAEAANSNTVQKFFLGGIQVGGDNTTGAASNNYVSYLWKGGVPTANGSGSIASVVSVNAAAGFSILSYAGTSSGNGDNKTVGHGLSGAPKMVIIKARSGGAENWYAWHTGISGTSWIALNQTSGSTSDNTRFYQAPDATLLYLGGNSGVCQSGYNYVGYAWAEISGYSKIGSYTGNGSADGPFVWCGFRPKWVMIKNVSAAADWILVDAERQTYNVVGNYFRVSQNFAEQSAINLDLVANGFKLRTDSTSVSLNATNTYIFMAFAEAPFKYANAR
ncbi:MAG: hypothetical protein BroJett040_05750 [Oligoflexia bacterium]|nr:MAG: hypothetical protein BroJett040_05750 [Oligoflexia bacterium]